jgi:hypothetical protein
LQDKSIDNMLRHLHRECINGRQEGLERVLALMRLCHADGLKNPSRFAALAGSLGAASAGGRDGGSAGLV